MLRLTSRCNITLATSTVWGEPEIRRGFSLAGLLFSYIDKWMKYGLFLKWLASKYIPSPLILIKLKIWEMGTCLAERITIQFLHVEIDDKNN